MNTSMHQEIESQAQIQHIQLDRGGLQDKTENELDESSQVKQLKAMNEIANASPQAQNLTQLNAIANGGDSNGPAALPQAKNNTGLPDQLKSGIENLGGFAMDDVKVHYNSSKPAQLKAHAYAQGTDIHLAPGQEKHLPHEAWHVVQQKQGRVKPTLQMKGIAINDDSALETEADVMGDRAMGVASNRGRAPQQSAGFQKIVQYKKVPLTSQGIVQAKLVYPQGGKLGDDEVKEIIRRYPEAKDRVLEAHNAAEEFTIIATRQGLRINENRPNGKGWAWRLSDGDALDMVNATMYEVALDFGVGMKVKRTPMTEQFTKDQLQHGSSSGDYVGADKLRSGKKLKESGLARTHHLADSSIRGIIEWLFLNKAWWISSVEKKRAIYGWMEALTHGLGWHDRMLGMLMNSRTLSDCDAIVNGLSNNPYNVGFGDASVNSAVGPNFDQSLNQDGSISEVANRIFEGTRLLSIWNVVPLPMVAAALNRVITKSSGAVKRSMRKE